MSSRKVSVDILLLHIVFLLIFASFITRRLRLATSLIILLLTLINSVALFSPCVTMKVLECNAKVLSTLFSLLHCLLRMSKPIPVFQSSGSCFLDWSTNLNQRFVALVSFLLSVFCCCCPGRRNMSWLLKNLSRTEKSHPCSRVLSRHGSSLGFNCCCLKLKKSSVMIYDQSGAKLFKTFVANIS